MNIKENKGLILIIIGIILSCTIYGMVIGIPLIILGTYFLYNKSKKREEFLDNRLNTKREEIRNINKKLEKLEKDKEKEIDEKLKDKREELDNIDEKLDQLEKERINEVDNQIKDKIDKLNNLNEKYDKLEKQKQMALDYKLKDKQKEYNELTIKIKSLKKEIVNDEDEIEMQSYGLYKPHYNFVNAISYKERLDAIRKEQKQMIKDKTAAICVKEWTIDGDKNKGKSFTNSNIKQILRSFNLESEIIINKVKHSNIEQSEKRLRKSFDQLNKLNDKVNVKITTHYLNLKMDELHLAYEYEVKKQEEKELLREAREREREEKKIQKELQKEKNKFNKENDKLNKEIEEIKKQMTNSAEEEKSKLQAEIEKLKQALNKNNEEIEKINEWKEKPGAGYVYIISNIGSFGKGVFKIGVTRRDNPEDRIRELSSASVPFRYDTHVFIFSKDAYELESKLHKRFEKQRVNKVNKRKEFFRITMDDVKQIVEENKGAVHSFVEKPDAEEYYDTLKIEKRMGLT